VLNYPLNLSFKLLAINPQVKVTDASGKTVLYLKEKAMSFKIDIRVFSDESQKNQVYQIKADKAIGINIPFSITTPEGTKIGSVQRPGMISLWKATYNISNGSGAQVGVLHEENPWLKVLDNLFSEIPFVHTLINPAYLVELGGKQVLYLKKQPSLTDRQFRLEKRADLSDADEKLLIPSVLLALMLERMRG